MNEIYIILFLQTMKDKSDQLEKNNTYTFVQKN